MVTVIGDVHGMLEMLQKLSKEIPDGSRVCFTGDLVDRGQRSAEVVLLVRDSGWDCVLGNHEKMMVDSLLPYITQDPTISAWDHREAVENWFRNGGEATLESYGYATRDDRLGVVTGRVPVTRELASDVRWMRNLPYYREYVDEVDDQGRHLVVSHSSVLTTWSTRDTPEGREYTIWGRRGIFCPQEGTGHLFGVFGHTPFKEVIVDTGCCCVDTGAFTGRGGLSAYVYPEGRVLSITSAAEEEQQTP